MTESKFEDALSTLSGHISQASQFWFAGATINEVSKDPKTNAAIQFTAGFWICARLALEQQAIVVVGKIFGQRSSNPTNIDSFFEVLRESRLTVFSREALAARKRQQMPTITDSQLADLLKTARVPTEADLKRLYTISKRHRRTYETQFAPLRNRHIAHSDVMTDADRAAMFQGTHIPDLEKLIMFLSQFQEALRGLYYDGRRPVMRRMRWSVRSLVAKKIRELNQLPDHEFIVSETRKMLFLLTQAASALPPGYKRSGSWG
jgi:hypothetical protein